MAKSKLIPSSRGRRSGGSARRLAAFALLVLGAACGAESPAPDPSLPSFLESPLVLGALLCATGPQASRVATVERAAILAEELVNGSTRAYPDLAPAEIPCRKNATCGVWAGRGAGGQTLRAPLELRIGDGEGRVDRNLVAAGDLVAQSHVPLIIGPCNTDETLAVQAQVTTTTVVLATPIATGAPVSDIDDRTAADKAAGKPGYVYRTITPDYIQAQVMAQTASNAFDPADPVYPWPDLVRYEDQTTEECTLDAGDSGCMQKFAGQGSYLCLPSLRSSAFPYEIYEVTQTACTPDAESRDQRVCDALGLNYLCLPSPAGGGAVCSRYRYKKYCTRYVRPRTALGLFANTEEGRSQWQEIRRYWETQKQNFVLAEVAFDPSVPTEFATLVKKLFEDGAAGLAQLRQAGSLGQSTPLEDTVVFLLASETEAALLLQEWQSQTAAAALPAGSDRVFWIGTAELRSRLFLDSIAFPPVRNLWLVDPYTTDLNNAPSFEQLFLDRWGVPSGDFSANVFDTVLLAALANEHAGEPRAAAALGALDRNGAAALKDSFSVVSNGCERPTLQDCPSDTVVEIYSPDDLSAAMMAIAQKKKVRFQGVSGKLGLTPAGDRMGDFNLWRVEEKDSRKSFFLTHRDSPESHGITLRE